MSIDNGGAPGERITMWLAALRIQKILRSAGYNADLTKSGANENVGLLERVREAINDHATIAVSLHYSGGIPFGGASAAARDGAVVAPLGQRFPWIYNEDGDIGFNVRDHTTGIATGIERAAPIAPCLRRHA